MASHSPVASLAAPESAASSRRLLDLSTTSSITAARDKPAKRPSSSALTPSKLQTASPAKSRPGSVSSVGSAFSSCLPFRKQWSTPSSYAPSVFSDTEPTDSSSVITGFSSVTSGTHSHESARRSRYRRKDHLHDSRPAFECVFWFLRCSYVSHDADQWRTHCLSHFRGSSPPKAVKCPLCEDFEEFHDDGRTAWDAEMDHLSRNHLLLGDSLVGTKPDCHLLNYLWRTRLIADEDFKVLRGESTPCSPVIQVEDKKRSKRSEVASPQWPANRSRPDITEWLEKVKPHDETADRPVDALKLTLPPAETVSHDIQEWLDQAKTRVATLSPSHKRSMRSIRGQKHRSYPSVVIHNNQGALQDYVMPTGRGTPLPPSPRMTSSGREVSSLPEKTRVPTSHYPLLADIEEGEEEEDYVTRVFDCHDSTASSDAGDHQLSLSSESAKQDAGSDTSNASVSSASSVDRDKLLEELVQNVCSMLSSTAITKTTPTSRPSDARGNGPPSGRRSGAWNLPGGSDGSGFPPGRSPGRGGKDRASRSPGDGDGDGDRSTNREDSTSDVDQSGGRKLACPYFKRNPQKYQQVRSCPGPGWDTVHRLKEHLYRRHALPIRCRRCFETFKTDALLDNHYQAAEPCKRRSPPHVEGFDKAQEKSLKNRKRKPGVETEEDKWREVYRILFPKDDPKSVPSPYYGCDDMGKRSRENSTDSSFLTRQYQDFLRDDLPRRVRRRLELASDDELRDNIKNQVEDIIRDCQEQSYRAFRESVTSIPGPISSASPPDVNPIMFRNVDYSPAAATAGPSQPLGLQNHASLGQLMDPTDPLDPLDPMDPMDPLNPTLEEWSPGHIMYSDIGPFGEIMPLPDSGYTSQSSTHRPSLTDCSFSINEGEEGWNMYNSGEHFSIFPSEPDWQPQPQPQSMDGQSYNHALNPLNMPAFNDYAGKGKEKVSEPTHPGDDFLGTM